MRASVFLYRITEFMPLGAHLTIPSIHCMAAAHQPLSQA